MGWLLSIAIIFAAYGAMLFALWTYDWWKARELR